MQPTRVLLICLGGLVLLLARAASPSAVGQEKAQAPQAGDDSPYPLDLQFLGTSSCASMACHNGNGPRGALRSEYTTWVVHDRHARAYDVLFDLKSQTIIKNLNRARTETKLRPAHEEKLCLSCHVRFGYDEARHHPRFTREDGVGCESCHGPAQKWISTHYTDEWKTLSWEKKRALGFANTKDLHTRARLCLDCHVGAGDADVNHDLIAAGHPRLNFEFGAYHANMPRHWSAQKDRTRYPALEAQAWTMGQVMTAQAALRLLEHRAQAAANPKRQPWPEFAEYNCFACHHDLQPKSWRQAKEYYGKRRPGTLPWNEWYTTLLPVAAGASVKDELANLRQSMERPYPDRKAVIAEARALLGRLQGLPAKLAKNGGDAPAILAQMKRIAGQEVPPVPSWDEAAQLYLALAAHHHALSDLDSAPGENWKGALKKLAGALEFPKGYDSPRTFDPGTVRERLEAFQQLGSK